MEAEALLADKAYDADKRVIEPLEAVGKIAVIRPKKNRKSPRTYDKAWYVARHLIENFFCWVKQFRAIATRYDKDRKKLPGRVVRHLAGWPATALLRRRPVVAMTGVAHDILIAHAYVVGRGDEAEAQRMPAKPRWKPA
jgi:transposase